MVGQCSVKDPVKALLDKIARGNGQLASSDFDDFVNAVRVCFAGDTHRQVALIAKQAVADAQRDAMVQNQWQEHDEALRTEMNNLRNQIAEQSRTIMLLTTHASHYPRTICSSNESGSCSFSG